MGAQGDIAERVGAVRRRINSAAQRAERDPAAIRLIAVTKGVATPQIREAIAAGVADIGENRVQEALRKREAIADGVAWHLIGHLQTNKAKPAAALFDAVHSLDSERVAGALAQHRPAELEPMAALIEVDFTAVPGRTGVAEAGVEPLLRACATLPRMHVVGLMTIAPFVGEVSVARSHFSRLRTLRDRVEQATAWPLPELSMGMTGDFEVAIEEGATLVRVGRAIFGERH